MFEIVSVKADIIHSNPFVLNPVYVQCSSIKRDLTIFAKNYIRRASVQIHALRGSAVVPAATYLFFHSQTLLTNSSRLRSDFFIP
jgi:hypothetical protein